MVLILLTKDLSVGKVRNMCCMHGVLFFVVAFDLLRVCVRGFLGFGNYFFQTIFISSVRLSGSAMGTLFSQFKHTSGGKLS